MSEKEVLKAGELLKSAVEQTRKPPFLPLLGLSILVSMVAATFAEQSDEVSLVSSIALAVVSAFLQIALILAAADPEPSRSADHWIKAAFKRRCFWRFFLASLFSFVLVALGILALVIPGFIIGGYLALAPVAAVLERTRGGESLRRSVTLSAPARRPIGYVFGLMVIVPNAALQVALFLGREEVPFSVWLVLELVSVFLFFVALLALTRAFLLLGGTREPLANSKEWPG